LKKYRNSPVERLEGDLFYVDNTNRFTLCAKKLSIISIFPSYLLPEPKGNRIRETLSRNRNIETVIDALNYLRMTNLTEADCAWLREYYLKIGPHTTRTLWNIVELKMAFEKVRLVWAMRSLNESLDDLVKSVEEIATEAVRAGRKRSLGSSHEIDESIRWADLQRRKVRVLERARELSSCVLSGEGV
jgi:hypothetical protein